MKKELFILGSGGFAKEVYFHFNKLEEFHILGFIDCIEKDPIYIYENAVPVINEDIFINNPKYKNSSLVMGVGNPQLIKALSVKFRDYNFPNLIHPNAICDKRLVKMGQGNIITPGVIFTIDIKIGSFNIFNLSSTVGHDVIIGNFNVVNPTVNISGFVNIGDTNLLGVSSTILQDNKIGNNTIIGASSLVTKNIEDFSIVVCVPSKKIGQCKME